MSYELPEARITRGDRNITARYDTGKRKEADYTGEEGIIIFSLSVSHNKAGINYWNGTVTKEDYFSVSISNEVERNRSRSFIMGSGLGLTKIPCGKRFNRKKLEATWAEWQEKIEGIFSVDAKLLNAEQQMLLTYLVPYLNGQKAGLA